MSKNVIFGLILTAIVLIFVIILQHQNMQIKEQNDAIRDKQTEDSIRRADDSLKMKLIYLDKQRDSINNLRKIDSLIHKGKTIIINKKLKKDEAIIKVLPNSNTTFRDSLWSRAK
jgi:hypothetical protein